MSNLALQASSCYNRGMNIVVSEGTVNTLKTLIHLQLKERCIMDSISSNTPQDKACSKCTRIFPATPDYFPRVKSGEDKLKSMCKQCQQDYARAYYQKHQEQLRAYSAQYRSENPDVIKNYTAYYQEKHKEEIKARKAQYNANHREENKAYNARWHAEHREHDKEYSIRYNTEHHEERLAGYKRYREEHRDERNKRTRAYRQTERGRHMHRLHANNRHIRKKSIDGALTDEQIQQKLLLQKYRCYYCQSKLEKNNKLPHEWFEGGRLL